MVYHCCILLHSGFHLLFANTFVYCLFMYCTHRIHTSSLRSVFCTCKVFQALVSCDVSLGPVSIIYFVIKCFCGSTICKKISQSCESIESKIYYSTQCFSLKCHCYTQSNSSPVVTFPLISVF